MKIYCVRKYDGDILVSILKNKNDNTYSFINISKEHICSCRFKTINDALEDMEHRKREGLISDYFEILMR